MGNEQGRGRGGKGGVRRKYMGTYAFSRYVDEIEARAQGCECFGGREGVIVGDDFVFAVLDTNNARFDFSFA